ncbi:MAG: 50S ribosomal protein L32 [Lentisphaeria bacterium]|nr:50S ribosomal protein L32 [Lentisphaeria bacterium]
MAVQQCRVSKTRMRTRKGANQYKGVETGKCATCGEPVLPHRVCKKCGYYGKRQVMTISSE